jgi:hypothetical protein
MDRMTSYPTLDWKGKIRKSNNIDLVTISSSTSTLTDDIVVLIAVQVDVTGEHQAATLLSGERRSRTNKKWLAARSND